MDIEIMPGSYAVCQTPPGSDNFSWIDRGKFWSVTGTHDEISLVCSEDIVPESIKKEIGWALLRIVGPLDFSLVGVLSGILHPLAENQISVYTISTYNTDYFLVKKTQIDLTVKVLEKCGCKVRRCNNDGTES